MAQVTRPRRVLRYTWRVHLAATILILHTAVSVQQHWAPVPEDGPVFDTEVGVWFEGRQIPVTNDETMDNLERIFRAEGREDLAAEIRSLRGREDASALPCCTLQLSACMAPALFVGVGLVAGIALPLLWAPLAGGLVWTILAGLAGGATVGVLSSAGLGTSGVWWLLVNAVDYWEVRSLVDRFNRTRDRAHRLVLFQIDGGRDDEEGLPGEQLY